MQVQVRGYAMCLMAGGWPSSLLVLADGAGWCWLLAAGLPAGSCEPQRPSLRRLV
jgi:hypothetical protein